MFSNIRSSIFTKIYAGLIITCIVVACVFYFMFDGINQYRHKKYRESMATGAFYLVAAGVARQQDEYARLNWLDDASSLFDSRFQVIPRSKIQFSSEEEKRLSRYDAVVHYSEDHKYADIFQKIPNEDNVLVVRVDKLTEQQVKAIAIFLLDDLAYFPNQERQRLEMIQQYFSYPLSWQKLRDLDLDRDQIARIRRKEIVMLLRDATKSNSSSISLIIPDRKYDEVIVMGPINLYNPTPLNVIISLIILSLGLISLAVYGLLFPLERKIRFIQQGVNKVGSGKLNTTVKVSGNDEMAHLANNFNRMTVHIKRLMDTQREMIRAVSHELRTPVARIRFAVDMMADTDDKESRFEQLDNIDKDIQALDTLIDEILTYAKLEQSSPKLDFEQIKLKEIVKQIVDETNALGRNVTVLSSHIPEKAVVVCDRRYLHRVLQNLAGNATRYANSTIFINAGVHKNRAYISVEDDGAGIPEKDRSKVFQPFARLDDSRTQSTGGYGLGLSIVSRIAFWFDGSMKVDESPQLKGARFTMTWPAKPNGYTKKTDKKSTQNKQE